MYLTAVFLMGCQRNHNNDSFVKTDSIEVHLLPIPSDQKGETIRATGLFTTDDEAVLGFKNGGVITDIYVKEGDQIRKGQVLAKVETPDISARSRQAQLGVDKALRDYERIQKLFEDSIATLEQLQNTRTALDVARQDLVAVKYNEDVSQLRSSVNGKVLAKLASVGQVVGPGTPVLQVNGAGNKPWQLKVGVSDRQWSVIKIGDKAAIRSDALGDREYEAVVSNKSEGIDPRSGTFNVWLEFAPRQEIKLASGVFGEAWIYSHSGSETWEIPFDALIEATGKEGYVYVTNDKRTAKRQKVQIMSFDNEKVYISKGLEDVQSVILSKSPYLKEGSSIIVQGK